jgi:hypothetical protein
MKRLKLKVGDVFEIPINDSLVGYGQIVRAGKVLYVVIFGGRKWCQEPFIAQEATAPTARKRSARWSDATGTWVKE